MTIDVCMQLLQLCDSTTAIISIQCCIILKILIRDVSTFIVIWLQLHLWRKTSCTLQTAGFLFTSTVMGVECKHLHWQIQAKLLLLTLISGRFNLGGTYFLVVILHGYSFWLRWNCSSFPSLIYGQITNLFFFYEYFTNTLEIFVTARHHLASHTFCDIYMVTPSDWGETVAIIFYKHIWDYQAISTDLQFAQYVLCVLLDTSVQTWSDDLVRCGSQSNCCNSTQWIRTGGTGEFKNECYR